MRNVTKRLKTHLHNGSVYFSSGSFPQKVNIFGEITAKKKVFLEAVAPSLKRQSDYFLLLYLFQCVVSDLVNLFQWRGCDHVCYTNFLVETLISLFFGLYDLLQLA
jgi:hypothetical protein